MIHAESSRRFDLLCQLSFQPFAPESPQGFNSQEQSQCLWNIRDTFSKCIKSMLPCPTHCSGGEKSRYSALTDGCSEELLPRWMIHAIQILGSKQNRNQQRLWHHPILRNQQRSFLAPESSRSRRAEGSSLWQWLGTSLNEHCMKQIEAARSRILVKAEWIRASTVFLNTKRRNGMQVLDLVGYIPRSESLGGYPIYPIYESLWQILTNSRKGSACRSAEG